MSCTAIVPEGENPEVVFLHKYFQGYLLLCHSCPQHQHIPPRYHPPPPPILSVVFATTSLCMAPLVQEDLSGVLIPKKLERGPSSMDRTSPRSNIVLPTTQPNLTWGWHCFPLHVAVSSRGGGSYRGEWVPYVPPIWF